MAFQQIPVKIEVPRDGNGKPWVVPPEGGRPIGLQRTTTFVDVLESKDSITRWKARTAAWAMSLPECAGIAAEIAKLDPVGSPEEKRKLDGLVEALMDKSGANAKRDRGTLLHAYTELIDGGLPLPESILPEDRERMEAYREGTDLFDVKHMEEFVVMARLGAGGTPDRVAAYCGPGPDGGWFDSEEDGLLITDVKTGNIEYGILKMMGQLGSYKEGKLYDPSKYPVLPVLHKRTGQPLVDPDGKKSFAAWKKIEHEPVEGAYTDLGNVNQEWGVIIHLPSTGEPECTLHWINLSIGLEVAEEAVRIREMRKKASLPEAMFPVFGSKRLEMPDLEPAGF